MKVGWRLLLAQVSAAVSRPSQLCGSVRGSMETCQMGFCAPRCIVQTQAADCSTEGDTGSTTDVSTVKHFCSEIVWLNYLIYYFLNCFLLVEKQQSDFCAGYYTVGQRRDRESDKMISSLQ